MKKIAKLLIVLLTVTLMSGIFVTTVFADEAEKEPTGNWLAQNYMNSGYEIPTGMSYNGENGTVTFSGALNAGIATTGFSYAKPLDVTNFSIDMVLDIPDVDKASWICLSFLDNLLNYDDGNPIPVNQPFNCMNGRGYYANNVQTGVVLQLWTSKLITDNTISLSYVEKNLDTITGVKNENGWNDVGNGRFVSNIKLDSEYDGKFKVSLTATEEGIAFNFNDGAWKGENPEQEGVFDQVLPCLNAGNALNGFKTYFTESDCYFSFVTMYSDGTHRPINITVNKVNGHSACDGSKPDYLENKVITNGNVKATIENGDIASFGVYAKWVDDIKVKTLDETDGDYEVVSERADKLKLKVADYFTVTPYSQGKEVSLGSYMDVEYTLPDNYKSYKLYFINEDGESQEMDEDFGKIEGNVAKIKVDNLSVYKIVIYGKEKGKGCKGNVFTGIPVILSLALVGGTMIKRKKGE